VYSRKLLAVHIAKQMTADELLKAVKKAFESRAGTHLQGCIIHSDRGSQYISGEYKQHQTKQDAIKHV
jgi:transposase InsO family protein